MTDVLRHVADILAAPLLIAVLGGALAAVCRARGHVVIARWLLALALTVGYLGALEPVGNALLGPLELQYSALGLREPLPEATAVVVLGSSYAPRDGVPITGALDQAGLARIVEGVRIARRLGTTRLVLSGGARPGYTPVAHGYAQLAADLGVDRAAFIVLDAPLNTGEEARAVAAVLGDERFVLVTSAYHMPRSMQEMLRAGAQPIPAPTGHLVNQAAKLGWRDLLPSSAGLRNSERALHEYLGLAALWVGII